ncbi:MAG: phosphoenolpyruvate synthase [Halanaerobiales bacterium]
MSEKTYVKWFDQLDSDDVEVVGGKNASLGEMITVLKDKGVRVPDGFATTAAAYWDFINENELEDKISEELDKWKSEEQSLDKTGKKIRRLIRDSRFPDGIADDIRKYYQELSKKYQVDELDVAVRSSATAEDLPEASFAGQQETFLNITGEEDLLEACRKCIASLFTDRAISYREEKGFDHEKVALSVGVQKMVRADSSGSGVMFTLDTETGFRDVVVINAAWGLGETVVQGTVVPDEYMVYKPLLADGEYKPIVEKEMGKKEKKMIYASGDSKTTKSIDASRDEMNSYVLSDEDILQLAEWAVHIEDHYQKPMDIEWAKDGKTNKLFIIQARPETVQSQKDEAVLNSYSLKEKGERILDGLAIGEAIAAGKVQIIKDPDDIDRFEEGSILVTGMTDPDWVPIMKKAAGIITEHGGRTSHAAIVSRELRVPAVVGIQEATGILENGQEITLSCAEGERGIIYQGILDFREKEIDLDEVPDIDTELMINLASPAAAFRWWRLPSSGVGLARMEFIINNIIKVHPMALLNLDNLESESVKKEIEEITRGYENKEEYFVEKLARGISKIAASQYPADVIVRMSDFKTNEYANLIGGKEYEPEEDNPMLGFRGASRYYSEQYRAGFELECRAIKYVRNKMGFENVIMMVPFVRTVEEADRVLDVLKDNGLVQGENGLEVYVMAEIPSNILLAEQFAERFDGFSIGSNDLTQLVLGIDRDSDELQDLFDERNPAVKKIIRDLIDTAHKKNRKVGICGQAPSDYPEFAEFLVEEGIDSMSLNPDSVIDVIYNLTDSKE